MLLDSLSPASLKKTHNRYVAHLQKVDAEMDQYERLMEGKLDPIQRIMMEKRRARLRREAETCRAYLDLLSSAQYTNDQDLIWRRSLQVA